MDHTFIDLKSPEVRKEIFDLITKSDAPENDVYEWTKYAGKLLWSYANQPQDTQLRVYMGLKIQIQKEFSSGQYDKCHNFIAEVYNKIPFIDPEETDDE